MKEAERQLRDSAVYSKLDTDPSNNLHTVVNQAVGKVSERGEIYDKIWEYLMVINHKM